MPKRYTPRESFLPLSYPTIREAEIREVEDTLRSGWITTGPKAARFEEQFSRLLGGSEALALSSATAGLHLGLIALALQPGDEVITPSITWASAVNMIELLGATPVFVDVDPHTLLIDVAAAAAAMTPRTVGLLPVHFAGAPCDLDSLQEIARSYDLWLFEDAAHALGTQYKGRQVGGFGELGVFSFHPIKNITTAEGGALACSSKELARKLRALRFHGLEKSAWERYRKEGSPQVEIAFPGFKYNFTDIQAALGLPQLRSLDEFNARRCALSCRYDERLAELVGVKPLTAPPWDHRHAHHLYVVAISEESGLNRDRFVEELKKRGIGTGIHFRAMHTQPYYARKYPEFMGRLPHSEWASAHICSLPLFPLMSDEDLDDVINAIRDTLACARG